MQIFGVYSGTIKSYTWEGKQVESAIFKEEVTSELFLGRLGLTTDEQAEMKYHGGIFKALYVYPGEYYPDWSEKLGRDLPPSAFGENVTTLGYTDEDIEHGDKFVIGEAIVEAIDPRIPCFKLNMRHNDPQMLKLFIREERYGTYFRVVEEGYIRAGDNFTCVDNSGSGISIKTMAAAFNRPKEHIDELSAIIQLPGLPEQTIQTYTTLLKRVSK